MNDIKFADTNITMSNFIESLRRFSDDTDKLFSEWPTFDSDLQEEYLSSMKWLINKAADYIEKTGNK